MEKLINPLWIIVFLQVPLATSVQSTEDGVSTLFIQCILSTLSTLSTLSPLSTPSSLSTPSTLSTSASILSMASTPHSHFASALVKVGRGRTEERRQCRHCNQSYSLSTSPTVLRQHLDIKHPGIPPPLPLSASSPSVCLPPSKKRTFQSTLEQTTLFINNEALRPALAALFARCSWAHHIVEFPEFINVISAVRTSTCPPPNRRQLRQSQIELAQSLRTRVVRQLRCYCRTSPLTVAIDGWTDVNSSKVTNVVILCGGEAYYWCSIVNSLSHNTAAWLKESLVRVLTGIREEGLMFTAMVADNERVNRTLWELLLVPFPFLIRSPCAAHLIQLCVNRALELPLIEPLFTSMECLLRQFKLKESRLKLKNLQVVNPLRATSASGIPVVYGLLRPQDTRWSSWLYAAQRLLMLRAYVDLVHQQDASFWSGLSELVTFLKPFQVATDVMQEDGSTLFDVWRQFKRLLTHVRGIPPLNLFHSSKEAIIHIILDLWEKHINIDAVIACAQLSFDSSADDIFPDKIQDARRWFLDFAAQYALYWRIADSDDADFALVKRTALREWSAFLGRTQGTCFDHLDIDIEELRKEYADDPPAFPRAVWNLYLVDAPIISHAAVAILSVCASEAAVERTFSAQGLVHSDLRNRLGDATIEAEMFIKFNQRTVERVEGQQPRVRRKGHSSGEAIGYCTEMGEEYEEVEALPSVTGLFTRPQLRAEEKVGVVESVEAMEVVGAVEAVEEKAEGVSAIISHVPCPPATDDVQLFIRHIVSVMVVTGKYRWSQSRMLQLWTEGQQWRPPMMDTDEVLRNKIMAYVRAQEVLQNPLTEEL
jgi:hypothetical protein